MAQTARCPETFYWTGSPWENGCNENFNGKPRDEFLNGEIFYTLKVAQVWLKDGVRNTTLSDRTARWITFPRHLKPGIIEKHNMVEL